MFRGDLPSPQVSLRWMPSPQWIDISCAPSRMWVLPVRSQRQQDFNHGHRPGLANWSDRSLKPPTVGDLRVSWHRSSNSLTWEQPAALPVFALCCCACAWSRGATGRPPHPVPLDLLSPTTRPNRPTARRMRTIGPRGAGSGTSSSFWRSTSDQMRSTWGRYDLFIFIWAVGFAAICICMRRQLSETKWAVLSGVDYGLLSKFEQVSFWWVNWRLGQWTACY